MLIVYFMNWLRMMLLTTFYARRHSEIQIQDQSYTWHTISTGALRSIGTLALERDTSFSHRRSWFRRQIRFIWNQQKIFHYQEPKFHPNWCSVYGEMVFLVNVFPQGVKRTKSTPKVPFLHIHSTNYLAEFFAVDSYKYSLKAFLHGSDFAHTYVGGIFKYLTNIA